MYIDLPVPQLSPCSVSRLRVHSYHTEVVAESKMLTQVALTTTHVQDLYI